MILVVCLASGVSQSAELCWSKNLSAQQVVYVGPKMDAQRIPLWSVNAAGDFKTNVFFEVDADLRVKIRYPQKDQQLGLPYNLYAIEIVNENGEIYFEDFTGACTGPGVSVYPGSTFFMQFLKENMAGYLKVYIWGRL